MFDISISMLRLKAKFPSPTKIGVCVGDQEAAMRANVLALKGRGDQVCIIESELKPHAARPEPIEEREEIQLDDNPEHKTHVRATMSLELKFELVTFL